MSDTKKLKQCADEIKTIFPKAWSVSINLRSDSESNNPKIWVTIYEYAVHGDYRTFDFESVNEMQEWVKDRKQGSRSIIYRKFDGVLK